MSIQDRKRDMWLSRWNRSTTRQGKSKRSVKEKGTRIMDNFSIHDEMTYEQRMREGPAGKVYPPISDKLFRQFLLVFVISMVMLFAFALLCLVVVGGTVGWIGFI